MATVQREHWQIVVLGLPVVWDGTRIDILVSRICLPPCKHPHMCARHDSNYSKERVACDKSTDKPQ